MGKEAIDHEYTDNIVCPYCGEEEIDSWEFTDDCGENQCGECRNEYHYERVITIDYTTSKK